MAVVFLRLPLPPNPKLKSYRISLRFLAGAYLTFAILLINIMVFNITWSEILSMKRLTISSLQATLLIIALITLINPKFVTGRYLIKQVLPVLIFNMLYFLFSWKWGSYKLLDYTQFSQHAFQPSVLIREIFALYYIFQIIYLSNLFFKQFRNYKAEIDNYFSEGYKFYLKWVKYNYYACLLLGISALVSCFVLSEFLLLIFNIADCIFYFVFGIYYIRYPNIFLKIEPVIYPSGNQIEENGKNKKRLVWAELKDNIIIKKYYLRPEVNIEEMAQHLKIGRSTLSNYINKEENMTFHEWMNTQRIEEAKRIFIEQPTQSIAQVSDLVGFTEPSNFSRQFKLITHLTPSEWKQKQLSKRAE